MFVQRNTTKGEDDNNEGRRTVFGFDDAFSNFVAITDS
jgi:hypothetical protein